MGVNAISVGVIPTPGIAFLTHDMRADAGIVISASHNPSQDNGIKIFNNEGFKLSDVKENKIEELIFADNIAGSIHLRKNWVNYHGWMTPPDVTWIF